MDKLRQEKLAFAKREKKYLKTKRCNICRKTGKVYRTYVLEKIKCYICDDCKSWFGEK